MRVGNCEWLYNPLVEQFQTVCGDWMLCVVPIATSDLDIMKWRPAIKYKGKLLMSIGEYKNFDDAAEHAIKTYKKLS